MAQKLKGIYDALDHGNYRSAIKLCSALLSKQPGHALCKALNAVALERTGQRDEALRLCGEVRGMPGADDTTLATVHVVYRRCRQLPDVLRMYEAALTAEPACDDFATAVFSSGLRCGEFAKAQQVATKLYSKSKSDKFLQWVVVALLLQARAEHSPKALNLASIMLQKCPVKATDAAGEKAAFDRSRLYVLLLHLDAMRMQGKHEAALELLESAKSAVGSPSDVVALKVQLLIEAGRLKEATSEARADYVRHYGDFGRAVAYIRLAFLCPAPEGLPRRRCTSPDGGDVEITDHCSRVRDASEAQSSEDEVWNALMLFRDVQQKSEDKAADFPPGTVRVAHLAELELMRAAFAANEKEAPGVHWHDTVDEVVYKTFTKKLEERLVHSAGKSYGFFDMKPYLCLLKDTAAASAISALGAAAATGPRAGPASATAARVRRALRRASGAADEGTLAADAAEVQALLAEFAESDKSAEGPADSLLLLAIVILVDMDRVACHMKKSDRRPHLLNALALAEEGIAVFPEAFQFKVVLVLLYGALGLPTAMMKWYSTMQIKNIQHESLSYLSFDSLCKAGPSAQIQESSRRIIEFHENMDKDSGEAVNMLFQNGVFHRVPEYLEAVRQVGRSVLWGRALVEEVQCEAGQAQTWEALVEATTRQSVILTGIVSAGVDTWVMRNQDRCLLNGTAPLPQCSPLGSLAYSAQAWRSGAATPTASLQSVPMDAVGSSGLLWRPLPQPGGEAKGPSSAEFAPPARSAATNGGAGGDVAAVRGASAVEELLTQGRDGAPGRLGTVAAMLSVLAHLLRDHPSSSQVSAALAAARVSATAAGLAPGDLPGAAEMRDRCRAAAAGCQAMWNPAPQDFRALSLGCGLAACGAAETILRVGAGKEAWEAVDQQLEALVAAVESIFDALGTAGGEDGAGVHFALGRPGIQLLWAWLHDGLAFIVPVALWCCTALPKAGSGKKVKEGQESLQKARVSLKGLLSALQAGLTGLGPQLAGAAAVPVHSQWPGEAAAFEVPEVPALAAGVERRADVVASVCAAHRCQLQAMQEAVSSRLALIKSRGAFKA